MKTIQLGIPDAEIDSVSYQLNQLLADENILYLKTRNFHWNVQGIHFRMLHSLFEDHYNQLDEIIDSLAERIRSVGHFAIGSMTQYLKLTRLLESDHAKGQSTKMIEGLLSDHETIIRLIRNTIESDRDVHDIATIDFLTSLLEKHEKMAWILRSLLD